MNKKELNSGLHQNAVVRGEKRTFEIYNNKFIKVVITRLLKKQSYHLNLTMLAPWPVQYKNTARHWLLAILCFSLTALAYISYLFYFQKSEASENFLPFIIPFIVSSLTAGFIFLYQTQNITEFKSRYGDCVVLSLLDNQPNEKEFKEFINEIKLRSLRASQEIKIDKHTMLNIEMNELRRLRNEKIISQHHYAEAKARVIKINL